MALLNKVSAFVVWGVAVYMAIKLTGNMSVDLIASRTDIQSTAFRYAVKAVKLCIQLPRLISEIKIKSDQIKIVTKMNALNASRKLLMVNGTHPIPNANMK